MRRAAWSLLPLLLGGLGIVGCGAEDPPRTARDTSPQASAEHVRADTIRGLRQRQHALKADAEAVDAEIVRASTASAFGPAFLNLNEAAKVATVRKWLEEARHPLELMETMRKGNESTYEAMKRVKALCDRRILLHDELAGVEREVAALGEKP